MPAWAQVRPAPSAPQVSPRLHGYLLDDGEFTTIDAPGAINTNASDINDRGEIVGFFLDANNGQ